MADGDPPAQRQRSKLSVDISDDVAGLIMPTKVDLEAATLRRERLGRRFVDHSRSMSEWPSGAVGLMADALKMAVLAEKGKGEDVGSEDEDEDENGQSCGTLKMMALPSQERKASIAARGNRGKRTTVLSQLRGSEQEKARPYAVKFYFASLGARAAHVCKPSDTFSQIRSRLWAKHPKVLGAVPAKGMVFTLAHGRFIFEDYDTFGRLLEVVNVFKDQPGQQTIEMHVVPEADVGAPLIYPKLRNDAVGELGVLASGSFRNSWKKKYCLLQGQTLALFGSEKAFKAGKQPEGCMLIGSCQSQVVAVGKQSNCFEVKSEHLAKQLRYTFRAPDDDELVAWLTALHEANLCETKVVVVSVAEELESRGLSHEGLFRKAGNQKKMDDLFRRFAEGQIVALNSVAIDDLTGIFKQSMREMPTPLMTFKLYRRWLELHGIEDPERKREATLKVFHELPVVNQGLLEFLLDFLRKVTQKEGENKMSAKNLAIVLGPTLLRPVEDTEETINDLKPVLGVMEYLIAEHQSIWPHYKKADLWLRGSSTSNAIKKAQLSGNLRPRPPTTPKMGVQPRQPSTPKAPGTPRAANLQPRPPTTPRSTRIARNRTSSMQMGSLPTILDSPDMPPPPPPTVVSADGARPKPPTHARKPSEAKPQPPKHGRKASATTGSGTHSRRSSQSQSLRDSRSSRSNSRTSMSSAPPSRKPSGPRPPTASRKGSSGAGPKPPRSRASSTSQHSSELHSWLAARDLDSPLLFRKLDENGISTSKELKDVTQGLDHRDISKALQLSSGMAQKVEAAVKGRKSSSASAAGMKHPKRVSMMDLSMIGNLESLKAGLKKTGNKQ